MTIKGILTNLLKCEYVQKGYILTEDEDLIYLYEPGSTSPHVFSVHGATVESIESKIIDIEQGGE